MPKYENEIVKIDNQVVKKISKKEKKCNREKYNIGKKNLEKYQDDDFDLYGISMD